MRLTLPLAASTGAQTDLLLLGLGGGAGGVFMRSGGYLGNDTTGTITANYAVAIGGGSATVKNASQIDGGKLGVGLSDGGIVANLLGGTITATHAVQISGGAGVVYDVGAINAGAGGTAVSFGAGFTNLMAIYPGASFIGTVDGGNTLGAASISTLRLRSPISGGPTVGTLTGLGSKYVNFAGITVSSGASWVLGAGTFGALGPNAYAATISDSGTLTNYAALRAPVVLRAGGRVINGAGGSIISERYGVDGRAIAGTIVNSGQIEGIRTGAIGIEGDGGAVTNQAQGTISGGVDGVLMLSNGPARIVNQA
jgi:hypothetical protein